MRFFCISSFLVCGVLRKFWNRFDRLFAVSRVRFNRIKVSFECYSLSVATAVLSGSPTSFVASHCRNERGRIHAFSKRS